MHFSFLYKNAFMTYCIMCV